MRLLLTCVVQFLNPVRAALLNVLRILCLVLPLATIYVLVGSFLYGEWWFGFIFRGKVLDSRYWKDGILFLINKHFNWTLVLIVLAGLFAFVIAKFWRGSAAAAIDKHFAAVSFTSALVLIVNVALLYNFKKESYAQYESILALTDVFNHTVDEYLNMENDKAVDGPYDFFYLDQDRVAALYSQLEPEMIKTQMTIKRSNEISGKGSAKIGSVDGELGGKHETAESSSYQSTSSSIQRKCVDVMKLLDSQHKLTHYSDREKWIIKRSTRDAREGIERIRHGESSDTFPVNREVYANLAACKDEACRSQEQKAYVLKSTKEAQERAKQWEEEMETELKTASGFVFIDGDFIVNNSQGESTQIWEEFSVKPLRIRFNGTLANSALELQRSERAHFKRMHMRVFASVIEPLDSNGLIRIRPIAAF